MANHQPHVPLGETTWEATAVDFRQVVNAIFYRADNGIARQSDANQFSRLAETVYGYYRKWVKKGLWEG